MECRESMDTRTKPWICGVELMKENHMVMGKDFIVGDKMLPPPFCPSGFERAEDNEYVLLRIMPKCDVREVKEEKRSCCGSAKVIYCKRKKATVTRKACLDCDEPVPVIGGNYAIRIRTELPEHV